MYICIPFREIGFKEAISLASPSPLMKLGPVFIVAVIRRNEASREINRPAMLSSRLTRFRFHGNDRPGPARYYVIYLRRVFGSRPVPRSLSVFPIPTAALSAHRCQPVGGWYGYTRRVSHPRDHHRHHLFPSLRERRSFFFSPSVASHRQRAVVDKSFPSNRTYGFLRYRKLQSREDAI